MVRVLVRRYPPLAERQPAKKRVVRPIAFAWPRPDAFQQRHELRPNRVDRRRVRNQQFRRRRRALRERRHIQDEMLDWKYLKGPLALTGHWKFAESHQRRLLQVSEHGFGIHLAP